MASVLHRCLLGDVYYSSIDNGLWSVGKWKRHLRLVSLLSLIARRNKTHFQNDKYPATYSYLALDDHKSSERENMLLQVELD